MSHKTKKVKDSKFLLKLIEKFDLPTLIYQFSSERQSFKKFENSLMFLMLFYTFLVIQNVIKLILIDNNDVENLIKYGSTGYYSGGVETRLIIDFSQISIDLLSLLLLIHYYLDRNEWLLNVNQIYNQIRNEEIDQIFEELGKGLLKSMKITRKLLVAFGLFTATLIYSVRLDHFIEYPISFLLTYFHSLFEALITFPLIYRHFILCFFICLKFIKLFEKVNIHLKFVSNRNELAKLLILHNRLGDSVMEANRFLEPVFTILTTLFSLIICYMTFNGIFSKLTAIPIVLIYCTALQFLILLIAMSSMIAYIDIEAKRGLHSVYRFAKSIKSKKLLFLASLTVLSFN